MDNTILVKELTRIKRSMVDKITDRIKDNNYNGINFIIEEEMNLAYNEIAKLLTKENTCSG